MKVSWRIGKIFGIDIYIDASWLVIFSLFTWIMVSYYFPSGYSHWPKWQYWVVGALTSILFFPSVLGHELAHSTYFFSLLSFSLSFSLRDYGLATRLFQNRNV